MTKTVEEIKQFILKEIKKCKAVHDATKEQFFYGRLKQAEYILNFIEDKTDGN